MIIADTSTAQSHNLKTLRNLFILLLVMTFGIHASKAQRKVRLVHAEQLQGGKKDEVSYDSFVGSVIFEHKGTNIYCDSAVFFKKENNLEAYGNVKIDDNDSVTVTSRLLLYDGNSQMAMLRQNVVFTKRGQMTLYTDFLDYDRKIEMAKFFNGGKLVDSTNTLESNRGYYQVPINMASFKKDVVGKSPDFTLKSDTLQYNTKSKTIFFRDHTELTNAEGEIFIYESGTYNAKDEQSVFYTGHIESPSYYLDGNELQFDESANFYSAKKNVRIVSKDNDVIILGEEAEYYEREGVIKVYNDALLKIRSGIDTLYLSADTLVSIDSDTLAKKRLLAYHNVKIYKEDLQGIADSLAYFQADSVLTFYNEPVLWTQSNQMSADSINLMIANSTISQLHMVNSAFIISKDTLLNFNQIKGRTVDAFFNNNQLETVYVEGNGESIFFMLDEENNIIIGMNKILCSEMRLNFVNSELDNISFYSNNEGSFIPPHELEEPETRLGGFKWLEDSKPSFEDVVPLRYLKYYKRPEKPSTEVVDEVFKPEAEQNESN